MDFRLNKQEILPLTLFFRIRTIPSTGRRATRGLWPIRAASFSCNTDPDPSPFVSHRQPLHILSPCPYNRYFRYTAFFIVTLLCSTFPAPPINLQAPNYTVTSIRPPTERGVLTFISVNGRKSPLLSMVPGSVTKDRNRKTPQRCKRCGKVQKGHGKYACSDGVAKLFQDLPFSASGQTLDTLKDYALRVLETYKNDQQTVSTLEGRLCALASVGFNVRGFLLHQDVMLSKEFDNRLFKEENMANAAGLRITIKPVVINLVKMNVSVDDALNKLFTFCGGEGDCTSDGLTFVAYVRKSVDDKADNRSLEDQIVMIKRWATYRGKGLQEALDLVHSNDTIAGLAVYRLDRFSRNTCHALGAIQDLVDKGKNFVSISEDGLLFGPLAVESQEISAMTQLLVKCLFAEIERLSAMKRTKDHVQTRREQEVGQSRFSPFGSIFTGTFDRKDFYSFDVADMKNRDKQANGVPEPLRLVQHTGENASVFVRSLKRFVKYQIKSGCEASMAADISFRMTILDATLTNPTWSDLVLDPVHNVEDWVMV
ncbi:hypothetical protein BC829DRAFT_414818 [Chytridium lagenaria]|nr:hypothetical protein BC829DRAFT_414818 [Chytridium lagenaria]